MLEPEKPKDGGTTGTTNKDQKDVAKSGGDKSGTDQNKK